MPMADSLAAFIPSSEYERDRSRFRMTFIRAPYIETCGEGAEVLAEVDGNIVAVKYKEQYGLAFHPELDEDDRIHEAFLESVKGYAQTR